MKRVKIRSIESMKKHGAYEYDEGLAHPNGNYFLSIMYQLCGKVVTIDESGRCLDSNPNWYIMDWMIETKQETIKDILDKTE